MCVLVNRKPDNFFKDFRNKQKSVLAPSAASGTLLVKMSLHTLSV